MIAEERDRLDRLERLREEGIDPYPARVERTHTLSEFEASFESLEKKGEEVGVLGRVRAVRKHGALTFLKIEDGSGEGQLMVRRDEVGDSSYDLLSDTIDVGDFVASSGTAIVTKTGAKSVLSKTVDIIVKATLPLPEKWHGLQDKELRFRKRYLDMIVNKDVKDTIIARSKIISSIRNLLDSKGYTEVETPTLQPIYGGGFAKPFKTHHNALDADFFLRISDEMYLKRCLVGGIESVYEITKVFRNEGIDHDHNPEFTMFEAQVAFKDYRYGMDIFEEIFENAAIKATGGTTAQHGDVTIDVARPWKRMSMVESLQEIAGIDVASWSSVEDAKKSLEGFGELAPKLHEMDRMNTLGELIAFAFEELVEERLIQPTIIYDYPVEVSPLAKRAEDPRFTERFEAFALGSEMGNNYSELNDPVDLEKRFVEEKKKEDAGFDEAHQTDYDYLDAIKHGMPPACGLGIGIDRMVMLLTGKSNIKEVIIFPTLRPKQELDK